MSSPPLFSMAPEIAAIIESRLHEIHDPDPRVVTLWPVAMGEAIATGTSSVELVVEAVLATMRSSAEIDALSGRHAAAVAASTPRATLRTRFRSRTPTESRGAHNDRPKGRWDLERQEGNESDD